MPDKTQNGNSVRPMDIVESDHKGFGKRHEQCLMLFIGLTIAYSMRACMGVALVAMTGTNKLSDNHTVNLNETVVNGHTVSTNNVVGTNDTETHGLMNALLFTPPYPQFKWSKKTQDSIMSSFFWGYMLLQIPAGQLAHWFGARYLLTGAMIINSIVSFAFPWAAYYGGWIPSMICRIVQGLSQACVMPGMHTFFGRWAPLQERGRLTALVYGGSALGVVVGIPITGFISASSLGWPGIFRFYGIVSGITAALLFWLLADTPAQHKTISAAERQYIEAGLGQTGSDGQRPPVPWKKILTSRAMYAIITAHIGQTWGQVTLMSEVPAYMDKVMGLNIKANGLLSALPFLVMWLTNFFFSWLTDMIIVKKIMSVTNTRKFSNSLGCIPSCLGFIALGYAPKNIYIVETLLVTICGFKIAAHSGFQVNHIDTAPNYAGTMMSIGNFISNLCGSLAPLVAGFILTDASSPYLWRQVFFVSAGLYFFTNLVYVLIGTAERADWNEPEYIYKQVAVEDGDEKKDGLLNEKKEDKVKIVE